MPTERTRARLRKLLAPCCLDCNGSNDVTPAGFDPLRPTMLTALPPEIFEKICAHLKPRDVVTLSTCSHAACSLARSSRLPWKQLDVFLHNPHRHIVGTKRITKAWPNVRFVFRMNERDPATNAAVMFGRSELIKWLSLAEPNCVRGVDFSHNLIEPSLVRGDGDPLWVEAMSMIKLGIFASNTHIANLSPFSNMCYVDVSYNTTITSSAIKALKSVRHIVIRACHNITVLEGLDCEIIDAPNCHSLVHIANLPRCFWINLEDTPISYVHRLATNTRASRKTYANLRACKHLTDLNPFLHFSRVDIRGCHHVVFGLEQARKSKTLELMASIPDQG